MAAADQESSQAPDDASSTPDLRHLAAQLEMDAQLSAYERLWLSGFLLRVADGDGDDAANQGAAAGRRARDQWIRVLRSRHFADLSAHRAAQEIVTGARRYSATAWLRDQDLAVVPVEYAGTRKECLWHALKSGAKFPEGWRQITTIITAAEA